MAKNCLIVEGGGFRTSFTAGVLDALIVAGYNPYNMVIGISGGAVAASYFLSAQYNYCLQAMMILVKDNNFTKYRRSLGEEGYMDIDFLSEVAGKKVPFDLSKALTSKTKENYFVATDRLSGEAIYLSPQEGDWIDCVVASCTLPFVTKGRHHVHGKEYFDGGWSDALPVQWAYDQGARSITILRTRPSGIHLKQSWSDYFASIYYRTDQQLRDTFAKAHERYNDSLIFIKNPPSDVVIKEISPRKELHSGVYSYSKKTVIRDYRNGLDKGLQYLNHWG